MGEEAHEEDPHEQVQMSWLMGLPPVGTEQQSPGAWHESWVLQQAVTSFPDSRPLQHELSPDVSTHLLKQCVQDWQESLQHHQQLGDLLFPVEEPLDSISFEEGACREMTPSPFKAPGNQQKRGRHRLRHRSPSPSKPPPADSVGPRKTPNDISPGQKGTTFDISTPQGLAGALGEWFVFELFSQLLPQFGWDCWVSSAKTVYPFRGTRAPAEGDGPYDFVYRDALGVLTGEPGMECFIEVKSTAGEGDSPFFMSEGEWRLAQRLERDEGQVGAARAMYLIVRVEHCSVGSVPRLCAILRDPAGMWRRGHLEVAVSHWVVNMRGARGDRQLRGA